MSYQLPDGQWVPQPGDVWTFDGLIWRPASPLVIPGPRGGGGGMGPRGPAGPAGPAGPGQTVVTPFQMIPVPTSSTGSLVFVDLIPPTPVNVVAAGNVLLDFDTSSLLLPPAGSVVADGANFQFLWDGAPLADFAFYEIDPTAPDSGLDSFAIPVRFRSLVVAPALGAHTVAVQWSVNIAGDVVNTFAGGGNLTVQTQPA